MEEKNKKNINRRDFIKIVGISAATSTAILYGCSSKGTSSSSSVSGEGEIPTDKMTYRTSPTPQPIHFSAFTTGILGESAISGSETTIWIAPVGQ